MIGQRDDQVNLAARSPATQPLPCVAGQAFCGIFELSYQLAARGLDYFTHNIIQDSNDSQEIAVTALLHTARKTNTGHSYYRSPANSALCEAAGQYAR